MLVVCLWCVSQKIIGSTYSKICIMFVVSFNDITYVVRQIVVEVLVF